MSCPRKACRQPFECRSSQVFHNCDCHAPRADPFQRSSRMSVDSDSTATNERQQTLHEIDSLTSEAEDTVSSLERSLTALKENLKQPKGVPKLSESMSDQGRAQLPLLILTMSHAESVDSIFPDWLTSAYPTSPGLPFRIFDLNLPVGIPMRSRRNYRTDPPITEHGRAISNIVGVELQATNQTAGFIYSAPEMRCVETAAALAKRWKRTTLIRVEPALSNWSSFAGRGSHVNWMTLEQMVSFGYPVDHTYEPILAFKDVPYKEHPSQYYDRLVNCYKKITEQNQAHKVVIVAHPTTVYLTGDGRWSKRKQLISINKQIGTCEVSGIYINSDGEVSHRHTVKPFTRTLYDAMELTRK
ncbi:hypothetical protein L596_028903 [Steinernema carpocapsae]|uniref:Uncharacterized protein n=1 Tax=Steinernema carpocapsae TaxID=34508 RepID=A0A4U5LZQ1_STECR|nr:hypothetical protein L596_028903 [Steinernema carpocapsae]